MTAEIDGHFAGTAGSLHNLYGLICIVYDLTAQNLRSIAPMPEQIGTPTMHFPELSGGTLKMHGSNLLWDGCYEFYF